MIWGRVYMLPRVDNIVPQITPSLSTKTIDFATLLETTQHIAKHYSKCV